MSDCIEPWILESLLVWVAQFPSCGCIATMMQDKQSPLNDNFVIVCKERGLNVELVLGPVETCPCPHGSTMLGPKKADI